MRSGAVRAATAALLVAPTLLLAACSSGSSAEDLRLPGGPTSAESATPVDLDATVYAPGGVPRPAVILAHGFGGSKADLDERARELSGRGYVVLAYSARGFGTSTGLISMNSPSSRSLTRARSSTISRPATTSCWTAPAIRGSASRGLVRRRAGPPSARGLRRPRRRRGVRHHLERPADIAVRAVRERRRRRAGRVQSRCGPATSSGWASSIATAPSPSAAASRPPGAPPTPTRRRAASSRPPRPSSCAPPPGSVTDRITAPTLISAGESDSLFPLAQANANAQQIMAADPGPR